MGVAIDEAGKHGHFGQVDYVGVPREGEVIADRLDFAVPDENGLICEHAAGVHIDQFACADGGDRGRRVGLLC